MSPARLIIGGCPEERLAAALELVHQEAQIASLQHPDLFLLNEGGAISIKQVRQLEKSLFLKPYQAQAKAAVVIEAGNLTIPAQNALLKTLEEPPANSLLILTAGQKETLLPTILSRCQLILLRDTVVRQNGQELEKTLLALTEILLAPMGKRFARVEEMPGGREEVANLIESFFEAWHHLLQMKVAQPISRTKSLADNLNFTQIQSGLENTFQALSALKSNVNPKLVVGNLFAVYPRLE